MANVVDRLGGASSNLAFKAPCRLGTTANITLSGFQTIDGTLPTSSDHVDLRRILVKNQTDAAENGTYIMDTGTWARTKDFDGVNDFRQGTRLYVFGGDTQSGTYVVTSSVDPSSFDLDTDNITFAAVGTFDETTSSLGIESGGKISFDSDDVTITHSSSALAFAGAGAGYTFAEGVTMSSAVTVSGAATLSGAVTASSAVTVSGTVTASSALLVSGAVVRGHTAAVTVDDIISPQIQAHSTDTGGASYLGVRWTNDANAARIVLGKSRGTAVSSHAVVQSGDSLGRIQWEGSDGSAFQGAAFIEAFVNGTPGSNDMPGRLSLAAASDGAGVATERVSIDSTGTQVVGLLQAVTGTTITLGGVAGTGILLFGSTTFGIYAGSSAPAIAAGQGSIYLRNDGGSSLTRAYIQSSGSTNTWVGLLTTA